MKRGRVWVEKEYEDRSLWRYVKIGNGSQIIAISKESYSNGKVEWWASANLSLFISGGDLSRSFDFHPTLISLCRELRATRQHIKAEILARQFAGVE